MTRHAKTIRTEPAAWVIALLAAVSAAADEPVAAISDTASGRNPAVTTVPPYPPLARRQRIEGETTVCFRIAPNGRILDPYVASSTHEIFRKPALQAIKDSSFEPLAAGEEMTPTVCRTYRFRLDPVTGS